VPVVEVEQFGARCDPVVDTHVDGFDHPRHMRADRDVLCIRFNDPDPGDGPRVRRAGRFKRRADPLRLVLSLVHLYHGER
jgi:hypothetical protein